MKLFVACACLCAVLATCSGDKFDDIISKVNSQHTTWKAGRNFDEDTPRSYFYHLAGVQPDYLENVVLSMKKPEGGEGMQVIPETFDARDAWPDCPSIRQVIDQSNCGSCWAVSVASVLSDRICIFKNKQVNISATDLLTCCKTCGDGCNGGWPQEAFKYFVDEGIVTGGFYGSEKGCKPYIIAPCQRSREQSCDLVSTPSCEKKCRNGYSKSYNQDKHMGRLAYQVDSNIEDIQREIIRNGPVQAAFKVYDDFLTYREGVYQHVTGRAAGWHAVKIIGWGKEQGEKYWLIANSWGKQWGKMNGFFKILRGRNEVNIEGQINAAIP